ncbi:pentatricopeptide repeat-containing protein At2g33680-like [Prosopis cineraria]|uniref:pentatricopeptide repeat-containing protein At2g33680-like n=1 Tax=Prosopis cineraria TaxID=364024 RepID=UPI00240ED0A5|nr:pentatricopeptide repeat-containing protein At2g33680-like [Prosopis cineraria]
MVLNDESRIEAHFTSPMAEGLFQALTPTTRLSSTSSSQLQVLSPLKPKTPNIGFLYPCYKHIRSQSIKLEVAQCLELSAAAICEPYSPQQDWPRLIQSSIEAKDLMLARAIHGSLIKFNCEDDLFVHNNLINVYSKFNKMADAQRVFDGMLVRNKVSWTTLMKGYLKNGDFESFFHIGRDMYKLGEKFNEHTCSVVLQACNSPEDCIHGEQVHAFIIKNGFEENVVVATSLVSMYSKSGCLENAEKVFDNLSAKDVQCINYMILEYGKAGFGSKAFLAFVDLLNDGLKPSDYTFTNTISASDSSIGLYEGKQLHGLAVKYGYMGETPLGNALITMYGQHGLVREAEKMFVELNARSLISWSAILSVFVKNRYTKKAVKLFLDMLEIGAYVDSVVLCIILDGCSECNNLESGLQIHGLTVKLGHASEVNIGTALIDLYAKCGCFQYARVVFDRLPSKTVASFNAILVGYLNSNFENDEDPMVLLHNLRLNDVRPDWVTFSRLLSLYADQACLVAGKSLHAYSIKTGIEAESAVGNAVITMYAKCGSIQDAYQIFSNMSHDHVTWNAIISAYSLQGDGNKALLLFEHMKEEGFPPDEITILSVLQASSYSGLWGNGICLFDEMESKYGIKPVIEHFACMVDLFGRAGKLAKAMDIIRESPFADSPLLWRTLVNACKQCGDLHIGMSASKKLLDLAPNEASSYILISNMYAEGGMLEEAAKVRTAMNDLKLTKETGSSWIEMDSEIHYFIASDREHPESREIYAILDLLRGEIAWSCNHSNNLQLLSDCL